MKKYSLVSLLASLAFVGRVQEDNSDIMKVGDAMPSSTIVSDNGNKLQSASLEEKVILVGLLAIWCPPCQKELATVQQTPWPEYENNKNFVLLVIGREHSDADLQEYDEKKDFDSPLYPDEDRAIFGAFAKSLVPRGYLVEKDGRIIYTGKGYTNEEFAELMTKIGGVLR